MADQSLSQNPSPQPEDKRSKNRKEESLSAPQDPPSAILNEDIKKDLIETLRLAAAMAPALETKRPTTLRDWIGGEPAGKDLRRRFLKIAGEAKKDLFNFRFVHLLDDVHPLLSPCIELKLAEQLNKFYGLVMRKESEHRLAGDIRDLLNDARIAASYAVEAGELIPSILTANHRNQGDAQLDETQAFNLKTMLELARSTLYEEWEQESAGDEDKSEFSIPELESWNADKPQNFSVYHEALDGLEHNTLPAAALRLLRKNPDDLPNALLGACFESLDTLAQFDAPRKMFPEGNCTPPAYEEIHSGIAGVSHLASLHMFVNDELADYLDELLSGEDADFEDSE